MIRQAAAGDLAAVRALSAEAYAVYLPLLGYLPLPANEDYAPRIARGEVWLLQRGGALAGLIVLEHEADHVMIYSIAVAPEFQGRGHASTLLRFAETQTHAWQLRETRLYTNALMERNIAIYRKAGYRETGRRPHPTRANVTVVDMSKALDGEALLPERVEVVGLDHVYLTVSELARSEAFYDTVLGLLDFRKIDAAIGGEPHRHYFNKLMQISIRPARGGAPHTNTHGGKHNPYAPGLHHLCLQVADNAAVDRLAGLLRDAGIAITEPAFYPQYAEDYYAIFFADPDGLRHEVVARRARRKLAVERWDELTSFLNPWATLKS